MQVRRYTKAWLPVFCLVVSSNCAKQKLAPLGAGVPSLPAVTVPAAARPSAPAQSKAAQPVTKVAQAKRVAPEVNNLLLESPRLSFSPDRGTQKQDTQKIDKITITVDAGTGALRPDSEAIVRIALKPLADQFLFACPDHMRVGSPDDCRFATKTGFADYFKQQLVALGVDTSQAAAVTILVNADLSSADKNAFEIRAAATGSSASNEQVWHVVPRNPGDHKLQLSVTPIARVVSAGDVKGEPILMSRSIEVTGADNFLTEYGPAVMGSLAALGLLAWIAWMVWRNPRSSALSSR